MAYPHPLLGRNGEKFFRKLKIGGEFFINIYENYHIGDALSESREEAEWFTQGNAAGIPPKCIYRIKVVKTKQVEGR